MGLPKAPVVVLPVGYPPGCTEAVERFALEPCASTARGLLPEGYEHAER